MLCLTLIRPTFPIAHRPSSSGDTLSLQRIEYLLGDQVFLEMLSGKHPYLTAAIKSLPLEEGGPVRVLPGDPVPDQERRLAERLVGICEGIMQGTRLGYVARASMHSCDVISFSWLRFMQSLHWLDYCCL